MISLTAMVWNHVQTIFYQVISLRAMVWNHLQTIFYLFLWEREREREMDDAARWKRVGASGSGSRSRSRSRSCDRNRSTKVLGFPVPSWLTLFFRVWDAAGIDVCGSWRSRAVGVANCQGSAAKKEWFHQNHCVRNMLNSIMFTFSCLVIHTHTQEERK